VLDSIFKQIFTRFYVVCFRFTKSPRINTRELGRNRLSPRCRLMTEPVERWRLFDRINARELGWNRLSPRCRLMTEPVERWRLFDRISDVILNSTHTPSSIGKWLQLWRSHSHHFGVIFIISFPWFEWDERHFVPVKNQINSSVLYLRVSQPIITISCLPNQITGAVSRHLHITGPLLKVEELEGRAFP
jgi:hypothetical protein